ncbi:MAG TPA: response regulator [Oligoflexus sp.]|uniref:response regulator transcription factor n=1 Tax=Oligoflexus sp. TaxID=1971216 RepID=UPI002D3B7F1D|nr:response regulator [Oligoflexus sp.]HYX33413.1 response regulator [Oligoflexus sp.]
MEQHERQRYTITLDDDPTIRLIIEHATGMISLPFASVGTLLARADRYSPVALFVDIHLGVDSWGLDAIPTLRTKWSCPIIVITADAASHLIGQALSLGAHDFIRKPIQVPELQARLLARIAEMSERIQQSVLHIGDVVYTSKRRLLELEDRKQFLAPYEAQIFEALVEAKGILMTKDELRCKVWGDIKVSDSALDKKIFTIRRALRDLGSQMTIETSYGKGLCLLVPRTGSRTGKVHAA